MRIHYGFGIALIPVALVLTVLTMIMGPLPIVTAIFCGGAAALLLEPWAAIRGGFRASFVGGLLVYGMQVVGGIIAGISVWYILGAIL